MATRVRKKKEEPVAFVVGEELGLDSAPAKVVAPDVTDETTDGLVFLREHLTRFPVAPVWPLQHLPSASQYASDSDSASAAVDSLAIRHALSNDKLDELRRWLLADAYAFAFMVCRHRNIVPEVHAPLAYAAAGQAQRLLWCLAVSGITGYVSDQFRKACETRGIAIDPYNQESVYKLDLALDWVNFRLPRGTYKSSVITHAGVVITATADPNTTNCITGAIDEKAWELCDQVGETMQSGVFADLYPDRVPGKADASMKKIKVPGRTVSSREKTVQAWSYTSKNETGVHADRRWIDDLVVGGKNGNANPTAMRGVESYLINLPNTFIMSRRNRVVHDGTRWGRFDDHVWLEKTECMSVVIPIEIYSTKTPDLMQRGTPTMPTFLPAEKIQAKQNRMWTDPEQTNAMEEWRCNNLLDPSADGGMIFDEEHLNDASRSWLGPFRNPKADMKKNGELYEKLFMVARKDGDKLIAVCPFEDPKDHTRPGVDVVMSVYSSWSYGAKEWAVTVAAVDSQLVRYQLETRVGVDGVDGWTKAVVDLATTYKPRTIGLDHAAHADNGIQNRLKTDAALRRLSRRIVPLQSQPNMQTSRVSSGVGEPFRNKKLLLLPKSDDAHGYTVTRKEMLRFRADMDTASPVLESLAMISALMRRVPTVKERERAKESQLMRDERNRQNVTREGFPSAA